MKTDPVRAPAAFTHEALMYAGDRAFLAGTTPFIREGVAAGEPVLVVVDARKIDLLRIRLGRDAEPVRFADMGEVGVNPARIIPAWRDFVDGHADEGPLRGIGEPIWAARRPAELVECQRHESLLNLAFEGSPFRLLCPYDAGALDASVLEEAHRSHPFIVEAGAERASARYRSIEEVAAGDDQQPLPDPPSGASVIRFRAADLHDARESVRAYANAAGLGIDRAADLVLAVGEVASNSLIHGGGRGTLLTWSDGHALICEVRDGGWMSRPLAGRERPGSTQPGGRGLWLANHLCELVQIRSSEVGTAVRLHMRLETKEGRWA